MLNNDNSTDRSNTLRVAIDGVEYDLTFRERIMTTATLTRRGPKGGTSRQEFTGVTWKHPKDPYSQLQAEAYALRDLAEVAGIDKSTLRELGEIVFKERYPVYLQSRYRNQVRERRYQQGKILDYLSPHVFRP